MVKMTIRRLLCTVFAVILTAASAAIPAFAAELPADYVNVAEGATVSVSKASSKTSGENSYEMAAENWCKAMLVDGKTNTGWSTNPYDVETDKTKPVTVTVDLGVVTEIARVVIVPTASGNNFPVAYSILTSADGENYTERAKSEGNPGVNKTKNVHDFTPVQARYVQMHVTERYAVESVGGGQSSDGLLVQLSEIEIWGKEAQRASLNKHALALLPGESAQLEMLLSGFANAVSVTWRSSDTSVATVDQNGKVSAKAKGEAIITAKAGNVTETCRVQVVEKKDRFDDNIMISIFWPPTKQYVNDEQYKLMADAGITYVMGAGDALGEKHVQEKMLELCAKYGMMMTVGDDRLGGNLLRMSEEEILAVVEEYKSVPGVGGYYMLDEPFNPNTFFDAYRILKSAEPDKYMHLNFLPAGAYANMDTYKSQLNDWCKLCASTGYPLDYLMYDRYPYGPAAGSMDRVGFLSNMAAVHEVGLANGVKTGAYIQSVCIPGAYRRPTDSEIRYEIYMYMAYGYKQISYFTWFTPVERSEPFADGIISATGVPNKHYAGVSKVNLEVLALGKVLIDCDALEIYLNGETWGQESIPEDFPVQPADKKNYTVSLLKSRVDGRNYIMVVNNDFSRQQTVELSLDADITALWEVSKKDGSLSSVSFNGGKLTLTLAAGDGVLLALPEGVDFAEPVTPAPIGSNLALDAQITCNSSTGTSNQYMDNLNDGERECDMSGTLGWVSNGPRESEIVIDLGYATDLNRVDIYPAGTGKQFGRNFGKTVIISVSEDGKSWTEVKRDESVSARDAFPTFTFDAVNARYVKLDIERYGSTLAIAEIEIFMDDGSVGAPGSIQRPNEEIIYTEGMNIALNRPYDVSSDTSQEYVAWGWSGKFINDGKLDNGWTSNVKIHDKAKATEYVVIDFGDVFAVDKIVVHPISDLWPEDFEILLSADGENWVSVDKQTASRKPDQPYTVQLAEPVPAIMLKFEATRLRNTAADGYMLQLAEIEAYGTPVCDKSALQAIMDEYVAAGGDVSAEAYVKAQAGMENALLTSTSMNVLVRTLKAAMPQPEQSGEEVTTEPIAGENTEPVGSIQESTAPGEETKRGCKSIVGACVPAVIVAAGVVCFGKRKRK
ncbi:MAG: discoidin domain-containing protein [Clostridia bacterium]|nr:discoidin domain-containing protein [Clostridia bacterium]